MALSVNYDSFLALCLGNGEHGIQPTLPATLREKRKVLSTDGLVALTVS